MDSTLKEFEQFDSTLRVLACTVRNVTDIWHEYEKEILQAAKADDLAAKHRIEKALVKRMESELTFLGIVFLATVLIKGWHTR